MGLESGSERPTGCGSPGNVACGRIGRSPMSMALYLLCMWMYSAFFLSWMLKSAAAARAAASAVRTTDEDGGEEFGANSGAALRTEGFQQNRGNCARSRSAAAGGDRPLLRLTFQTHLLDLQAHAGRPFVRYRPAGPLAVHARDRGRHLARQPRRQPDLRAGAHRAGWQAVYVPESPMDGSCPRAAQNLSLIHICKKRSVNSRLQIGDRYPMRYMYIGSPA